jgi:hypothetical protein
MIVLVVDVVLPRAGEYRPGSGHKEHKQYDKGSAHLTPLTFQKTTIFSEHRTIAPFMSRTRLHGLKAGCLGGQFLGRFLPDAHPGLTATVPSAGLGTVVPGSSN